MGFAMIVAVLGIAVFFIWVLHGLLTDLTSRVPRRIKAYAAIFRPSRKHGELIEMPLRTQVISKRRSKGERIAIVMLACVGTALPLHAQQTSSSPSTRSSGTQAGVSNKRVPQEVIEELEAMRKRIDQLEAELKKRDAVQQPTAIVHSTDAVDTAQSSASSSLVVSPAPVSGASQPVAASSETKSNDPWHGTTLNVGLDTYYANNFNNPVGRVNLLRAYDVLSNEFSLNQASVVIEHAPNVTEGSRWGGRLDLQFGQATDTLQGNPANEPRPDIYRNIFQVYGTYIVPVGKGWDVDFGKWASSLGIEGNYTKDQINYSRALWFNFLPFYHMGARVAIPVNDRFTINYWIVNGTNQVEATNGFKDQLFGFVAKPVKNVTWTMNYYLGQEHPDRLVSAACGSVPVQPGLCFSAISPAPNGKTNIFDSYATWQPNSKLTLAIEGDYFITRLWANAAPGESSAPSHVDGGAAYVQYQVTPKIALGTRAEYMSDRGGVFSGITQALKENTVTFDYKLADNFLMRYEWRRDFSNQPSFLTDRQGVLSKDQNTATLGLVWWWGGKQGSW